MKFKRSSVEATICATMKLLCDYLIAVLAIVAILLYYYFSKYSKLVKFYNQFPNPPTKLFVGNTFDLIKPTLILDTFHRYTKEYGSIVHVSKGFMKHYLLVSDYKFLEFLLSSNKILHKSLNMRYLSPWIGTGLVTADGGQKWKIHRKIITPTFHFKILEQFVDIFESSADVLIEILSKIKNNKSIDIQPYLTLCTLDAMWASAMGMKSNIQNSDEHASYYESAKQMCRLFIVRSISLTKGYDFIFRFTKDYEIQKKAVKVLHDYTDQAIARKLKELKTKKSEKNDEINDLGIKTKKVFLDMLLEATFNGQPLTKDEIREEVATFMFAGHDTTSVASSFLFYCLSKNKDVQDKILEEQQEIFGIDKNPEVTYQTLQSMKYLEKVIKEGLRLYPPIPFYGRHVNQDVEYNGMIIPKGVMILIFAKGVHMNPEYYPEPEKFNPDRWNDTDGKLPYAFLPFSAGPRNCIGQKFAMLELKSLVSKIIRNFEILPAEPEHTLQLSPETVLKSLNGIKISLKLRKN